MTKCPKCKFYSICGGRLNETVENCVRFKSTEQTNEERLRSATFEEMAGAIYEWYTLGYTRGKNGVKLNSITEVVEWLKEKRDGNVL